MIPSSFIPAVEKGVREAMEVGRARRLPGARSARDACSTAPTTRVDSSEIAFKLAGVQAMKQALEQADPVLLEPIMLVTLSVPEADVGDVIGDLNSRRGRPQGMEPVGAMTEIKAEVPMAEMLTYAPDLRSITDGQGDYTLEFLRYEEVPDHLAQKVVEQAGDERAAATRERDRGRAGGRPRLPSVRWQPGRSSPPSPTSRATSATAGCCAASSPTSSSPTASAARSASCALPGPPTRAGCARRAAVGQPAAERPRRGRSLLERLRQAGKPAGARRPQPRAARERAGRPCTTPATTPPRLR